MAIASPEPSTATWRAFPAASAARRLAVELGSSFQFALAVVVRLLLEAGEHSRIPFAELDGAEARMGWRGPRGDLLRALHVARIVDADAGDLVVALPDAVYGRGLAA
jgi:hypothetical protein